MGKKESRRPWPGGGYIHRQADGRDLFIIEREVNGVRYHISTRAHSPKAAAAQLARFEANPSEYRPDGDAAEVVLNQQLLDEYLDHLTAKGLTRRYIKSSGNILIDWRLAWGGRDLRRLDLRADLLEKLERWGGQKHRIIVVKAFFTWLRRKKALVKRTEDPTLDLTVPQSSPEKHRRRKVVPVEHLRAVLAKLDGAYADVFELHCATGMHLTEVERFVRGAEAELIQTGARAVVVVRHKTGVLTRVPLSEPSHIAAAERLRARGQMPRWYARTVKAACKVASVPDFTVGQVRHSIATYAREQGATPEQIAAFLHHRDKRTTEKFYIDLAEPVAAVPVPLLRVVR